MKKSIDRIIVCLDGSAQGNLLGGQAAALARRLGAKLIGLRSLTRPFPSPAETFARGAGAIRDVLKHQREAEQSVVLPARQDFEALARSFGLEAEFYPAWNDDPAPANLAGAGDLLVVGHPRLPGVSAPLSANQLLLGGACPVLVIPSDWTGAIGDRVLIGWNGTRAARQAVDEALPLIADDALAMVLVVDQASPGEPTADLAMALQAAGVSTVVKAVESRTSTVAGTITEVADEWAADLIVLGGYSRSPTIERLFGGVTRWLLATAPRPILLSYVPDEVRKATLPVDESPIPPGQTAPGAAFR